MALKKNGQEHNKLHLTISLDGNDTSHGHSTEVPHVPMSATTMPVVPAEPMEEIYMIMISAHTALSNARYTHHKVMLDRMDLRACRDIVNNKNSELMRLPHCIILMLLCCDCCDSVVKTGFYVCTYTEYDYVTSLQREKAPR